MVKHTLIVLAAYAALGAPLADARRPPDGYVDPPIDEVDQVQVPDDDEQPGFNMFGFDMAIGAQPRDGENALVMSLGLGVEHPVFKKSRVFGEYAWIWLLPTGEDERALTNPMRPERQASGHRASIGLRRELKASGKRSLRMFIDGELGGSVALVNDNMAGVELVPAGFVGLRAGYDLYSRRDSSPSRTFETALLFRMTGTADGVGFTFGLGMFWGN